MNINDLEKKDLEEAKEIVEILLGNITEEEIREKKEEAQRAEERRKEKVRQVEERGRKEARQLEEKKRREEKIRQEREAQSQWEIQEFGGKPFTELTVRDVFAAIAYTKSTWKPEYAGGKAYEDADILIAARLKKPEVVE